MTTPGPDAIVTLSRELVILDVLPERAIDVPDELKAHPRTLAINRGREAMRQDGLESTS